MNIQEAKEEIIRTVKVYTAKDERGAYRIAPVHQRPVLLIGPPGIGKTAIIRQAAEACHVGLVAYTITHHTRQSAVGLPVVENRTYQGKSFSVTEYTMSEIIASVYECMEYTGQKEGILFIDEINCVSETLTPTMLQFLQNKTFGTHKVPEGWVIVAAGNPPEYNRSARMFDVVTLDRVKSITVEVDFPVWKAYAAQQGIHSAVLSYLSVKPQNFYYIEDGRGDREFVTARGWEDLSVFLKACEQEGFEIGEEIIREYIHCPRIAGDFAGYYQLFCRYRSDYRIRELLEGGMAPEETLRQADQLARASSDEQYSVLQMLLSGLQEGLHACRKRQKLLDRKREVCRQLQDLSQREPKLEADQLAQRFAGQFQEALQIKETHRLLSDAESLRENEISRFLHAFYYELRQGRILNPQAGIEKMKQTLDQEAQRADREAEGLSQSLERCFDFLEKSLGEGEKMGCFMTSLASGQDAAAFLSTHPCQGYLRHLHLMEASEEEDQLRRQIAALDRENTRGC